MFFRILGSLTLIATVSGCKVVIDTTHVGYVRSDSWTYTCPENSRCEIDVTDAYFDESFVVVPDPGWEFVEWRKGGMYLCGASSESCSLSTRGFDANDGLMAFLHSTQRFYLTPIIRKIEPEAHSPDIEIAELDVRVSEGMVVTSSTDHILGAHNEGNLANSPYAEIYFKGDDRMYRLSTIDPYQHYFDIPGYHPTTWTYHKTADCTGEFYVMNAGFVYRKPYTDLYFVPDSYNSENLFPESAWTGVTCVTVEDSPLVGKQRNFNPVKPTNLSIPNGYLHIRNIGQR